MKSSSATDQFLKKLVLMVYILMLGHNGPDCQDPYELRTSPLIGLFRQHLTLLRDLCSLVQLRPTVIWIIN